MDNVVWMVRNQSDSDNYEYETSLQNRRVLSKSYDVQIMTSIIYLTYSFQSVDSIHNEFNLKTAQSRSETQGKIKEDSRIFGRSIWVSHVSPNQF